MAIDAEHVHIKFATKKMYLHYKNRQLKYQPGLPVHAECYLVQLFIACAYNHLAIS